MARVYSGSRLMLDPNFILSARKAADEREAAARDVRANIAKGLGQLGTTIGGTIDYALERKARNERREMMENAPDIADPEYKAAVERFVETGDIGGLNAYRTIKENRERMAREAAAREKELEIRKREAEAMAQRTALEDRKVNENLAETARLDLKAAENAYSNATTEREKTDAKIDIQRALLALRGAGEDISGYVYPDEARETITEKETETATDGGKSIKAQINDLKVRLDRGFETPEEQAEFIAEVEEKRKNAKGAEVDEFVSLIKEAQKKKDKLTRTNENVAAQKKKAATYAEKMKDNAEFFVWWAGLNDKDKAEYEAAYKAYGGK